MHKCLLAVNPLPKMITHNVFTTDRDTGAKILVEVAVICAIVQQPKAKIFMLP